MARVGKPANERMDVLVVDGRPFYAEVPDDLEVCCDCGLSHRIRYRIEDKGKNRIKNAKLKVTVWRDNRETNRRRGLPASTRPRTGFMVYVADSKRKRR